ncbi:hypothetical protein L1987_06437 [Smallanthus sonchifolius]|uniref:Uncharacterized protein n=1 Tax=Smallanthus sonchifolius TaxID=185202 RepID=A0ACB9JY57_9ASTR|nr:hypothetical protein L1987_06437 [Smallanthus sonchifolius]
MNRGLINSDLEARISLLTSNSFTLLFCSLPFCNSNPNSIYRWPLKSSTSTSRLPSLLNLGSPLSAKSIWCSFHLSRLHSFPADGNLCLKYQGIVAYVCDMILCFVMVMF